MLYQEVKRTKLVLQPYLTVILYTTQLYIAHRWQSTCNTQSCVLQTYVCAYIPTYVTCSLRIFIFYVIFSVCTVCDNITLMFRFDSVSFI